jgi:uncharacterized caspase-like protein
MGNNWAIVIGINHYEHLPQTKHLNFAVRDAEKMQEFLCNQAGFLSQNVLLCTDSSPPVSNISTRPSLTNLQRLLLEHIQLATEADHLWFFFAGHGMVGDDRYDYILPCDSYLAHLTGSAISINFIIECLRACKAKNVVLILDMCRKESAYPSRNTEVEIGEQTIRISRQKGIITIFSCNRGEYSYEIPKLQQGAFTHALIQGLSQYPVLWQLEQYLDREVPVLNRNYDLPIQVPLIICEPASKYNFPLLPTISVETSVSKLRYSSTLTELEDELDQETDLSSERFGANYYANLQVLLRASRWKDADEETADRMCEVMARRSEELTYAEKVVQEVPGFNRWLRMEDIEQFPLRDLRNIDRLWIKYSNGKFGFSVQKRIYLECGARPVVKYPGNRSWNEFGTRVGWRRNQSWIGCDDLVFDMSAPDGHLPSAVVGFSDFRYRSAGPLTSAWKCIHLFSKDYKDKDEDDLSSERFGDSYYSKLRDLLKSGKWEQADRETEAYMREVMNREKSRWLRMKDIEEFPCRDLQNIDRLWVKYSNGKFGFSVQGKIWQDCDEQIVDSMWKVFGERVGWYKSNGGVDYHSLTFDISAPEGHLPGFGLLWGHLGTFYGLWHFIRGQESLTVAGGLSFVSSLAQRLENCSTSVLVHS